MTKLLLKKLKNALRKEIGRAKDLIKSTLNPAEGSVDALEKIIKEAQDVVNNINATKEEVKNAKTKLDNAIEDFEGAQKKRLLKLLKKC